MQYNRIITEEEIARVFLKSNKDIRLYLKIKNKSRKVFPISYRAVKFTSGHRAGIALIELIDCECRVLGTVCIKYTFESVHNLQTEFKILKLFSENDILVPSAICFNHIVNLHLSYIIMEKVNGKNLRNTKFDKKMIQNLLRITEKHQEILKTNLHLLGLSSLQKRLNNKIDFEAKIRRYINDNPSPIRIHSSLSFLNKWLNTDTAVKKRTIVTDRSGENIIRSRNHLVFIDFSTLREGTEIDNMIQFFNDPRIMSKRSFHDFFEKNILNQKYKNSLEYFYTASIYTNILQGIFTYRNNPQISLQYFKTVNYYYRKFSRDKKGMLVDINHQHALESDRPIHQQTVQHSV